MRINATDMFTVLVKVNDDGEEEIDLVCKYHMPENMEMFAPEIAAQLYAIANEIHNPGEYN